MSIATAREAVIELLRGIRSVERSDTGRRILILVALAFLSASAGLRGRWQHLRNVAAHHRSARDAREALIEMAHEVERTRPQLGGVFVEILVDEVLRAGGALPEHVLRAAHLLEVLGGFDWSEAEFASWFDIALDTSSDAGPRSGEIATPRPLARLMVSLAELRPGQTVFDPSCGQGTVLAAAREASNDLDLYGQELNPVAFALATLRLALLGAPAKTQLGDSLRALTAWGVERGFDRVLCDPPLGAPLQGQAPIQLRGPFGGLDLTRSESLFVGLSASLLAPGGRAVILVPSSFLSRKGRDAALRDVLLNEGYVEGVLALPQGVLTWTNISLSLLVLHRPVERVENPSIILVDSSDLKLSGKRPSERLLDVHIQEMLDAYRQGTESTRVVRLSIGEAQQAEGLEPLRHRHSVVELMDIAAMLAQIEHLDEKAAASAKAISNALRMLKEDS